MADQEGEYYFGFRPLEELASRTGFQEDDHLFVAARRNPRAQKLLTRAKRAGVNIDFVGFRDLTSRLGHEKHQGIALKRQTDYPLVELDRSQVLQQQQRALYLALDGIVDPHNLGAIARSAAAFGVDGLIVPKRRSAPLGAAAFKSSAGMLARVPILEVGGIAGFLADAQKKDFTIVGTSLQGDELGGDVAKRLRAAENPVILVLGSEQKGLSRLVQERCTELVRIPHKKDVQSLNVSVAAGILLYEILGRDSD